MKFYRKYLVIFVIAIIAGLTLHLMLFYVNLGVPNQAARNNNGWLQVKDTYAQSINSPKIVFISGSNTLFGVDTERIEREFSIPTVNYGVNAGLLFYTLHRALPHLRNGDTVIIPLEYRFYAYKCTPVETGYAQYITGYDINTFKTLPLSIKISIICQLTTRELLKDTYHQLKPPPIDENNDYDSKYLNINGDMTNNLVAKKKSAKVLQSTLNDSVFKNTPVTSDAKKELTSFIDYCHANNITVYAAWPNYLWKEKEFTGKDLDGIHAIEEFYHEHDVEILGNYTDCLYDAEMFYDTRYHLNEEGKRIHTDYLIELLKEKIR